MVSSLNLLADGRYGITAWLSVAGVIRDAILLSHYDVFVIEWLWDDCHGRNYSTLPFKDMEVLSISAVFSIMGGLFISHISLLA